MKEKDTLYARYLNRDITEDELNTMRQDGAIVDLDRIIRTTDGWTMPTYDRDAGLGKIKSRRIAKSKNPRILYLRWASVAAVMVAFFALYALLKSAPEVEVMAANGINQQVDLVDGSKVTLNDGSSLSYTQEDWAEQRKIQLRGEALFEVESGASFEVETKNGRVEVLGTTFNVRAWGANLYVECYEGRVKVLTQKDEVILAVGESINIVDGAMRSKEQINHEAPLWSQDTSRFYEEDINDVFLELERQYNVTITAPKLTKSFSGVFLHDDLPEALGSVCKPLGIKYSLSQNGKEVLIEE